MLWNFVPLARDSSSPVRAAHIPNTVTDVTAQGARDWDHENEMHFHLIGWAVARKADASGGRKLSGTCLGRAPLRKWLVVIEVPQGRGAARSLAYLGVLVNEKLRVRSAAPWGGPLLVEVGGTTVAIGRSLASHIKVCALRGDQTGDETCRS
jgi:ferrous iron transport protein A